MILEVACTICGGSGWSPRAQGCGYDDVCDCGGSPHRPYTYEELYAEMREFKLEKLESEDAKWLLTALWATMEALRKVKYDVQPR